MRSLLKSLGWYFLLVAIPRISLFANRFTLPAPDGWTLNPFDILGIMFAVGLGMGTYVLSYFGSDNVSEEEVDDVNVEEMNARQKRAYQKRQSRWRDRQVASGRAKGASYVFALFDGIFNLSEVVTVAMSAGMIISLTKPANGDWLSLVALWIFGTFPTLASLLIGWVMGAVDRVPSSSYSNDAGIIDKLSGLFAPKKKVTSKRKRVEHPAPVVKKRKPVKTSNIGQQKRGRYDEFLLVIKSNNGINIDDRGKIKVEMDKEDNITLRSIDRYRKKYVEENK